MDFIDVKIKEVRTSKYSRRDDTFKLKIFLDINGKEKILEKEYKVSKAPLLTENLINDIKSSFKLNKNSGLEDYTMIRIHEQEKTEEKIENFFRKLTDKINGFRMHKSADGYLNMLYSIEGFSIKL